MRVVDELEELTKKTGALFKFLMDDDKTANLSEEEFGLLNEQYDAMSKYEGILIERIEYFTRNSPERDS